MDDQEATQRLQKAGAAVLERMKRCDNPDCHNCEALNVVLLRALSSEIAEVARAQYAELTQHRSSLFAMAVMALGGKWVLDLRKGQELPHVVLHQREVEAQVVEYTARVATAEEVASGKPA